LRHPQDAPAAMSTDHFHPDLAPSDRACRHGRARQALPRPTPSRAPGETYDASLSVQGRPGKRGVRVDVVGVVGGGGCVRAVVGGGVVRAGARPYLGPRPGVAPGRRHDGCWGDSADCVAAARSFRAVHACVAAGDCREPAAVHRCDEGLRAHEPFRSGGLQRLLAELAQGVVAALEQLARDR